MPAFQDLTEKKFTYLTVEERSDRKGKSGGTFWICKCQCGNKVTVAATDLKTGNTKSCGCLMIEKATIHGLSKTPEYAIYKAMIARCYDPSHPEYHNYGERGITVCDEWKENFEAFYRDMCPRPHSDLTLDRKNNSRGYSKANCRWITQADQNNNKRNNTYYEYRGERKSLADWCRELHRGYKVTSYRINQLNWTFEEAIQPIEDKTIIYEGVEKPLRDWCELMSLIHSDTYLRILRGEAFGDIVEE